MYATIQKWGNSQGLRIPKALLDEVGLKEHDRVELVQMDDGINIRRASSIPHRTLEERLTAFYGKPIDQIDRIEAEELDWGKAEGSEVPRNHPPPQFGSGRWRWAGTGRRCPP